VDLTDLIREALALVGIAVAVSFGAGFAAGWWARR
jgi:hypothetical protein